ncbi:MAG TPA: hypothetical protein VHK88_19720, partial [Aquihabitans sp.]|nr:hypothetical protein [Aquihabitans sp.]
MNVADLAKDLEVAPSTVLEGCQRLGIAAGWAGAELTASEQATLRAALASEAPAAGVPSRWAHQAEGAPADGHGPVTLTGADLAAATSGVDLGLGAGTGGGDTAVLDGVAPTGVVDAIDAGDGLAPGR